MSQRSLFEDDSAALPASEERPRVTAETSLIQLEASPVPLASEERTRRMTVLSEQARDCTRCGLSETRAHVVFGEGNENSPLVLVGEGPGETEDATGRPFVGRAGKLLDEVLAANGMSRRHVYICNVIKCRATLMENGRLKNRPPRVEESAACRSWLDTQLQLIQPQVIVCLGSPAANALIHPNFAIMRERGRWFRDNPYAPWIMAALHPAYILRQQGEGYETARASLVHDIGAARLKVVEIRKAARASDG